MRKPKITFGGMRELGVRGLLVPNVNSIFGPSWRKVRTHADLRTCCDLYQRILAISAAKRSVGNSINITALLEPPCFVWRLDYVFGLG